MNGYLLRKMSVYTLLAGIVVALYIGITLGNYLPDYATIEEPYPLRWIFAMGAFGISAIISSVFYTGSVLANIMAQK
ncbi:hypothetical protein [Pseudalkalibacillus hwajinpoensis]|uniref:Uncharacterized protein n=1 Tax=Guptibacillus hwajinpoensis TaxID=208199 RepID=A0A4U1MFL8_9BACL|nr:hypothetical protein [Pseudalkalibacillus hwajinpoensis]TKD69185.1 hypothetical protein FBF83_14360 [Pseudalkalibacillus hwajinpoensis]